MKKYTYNKQDYFSEYALRKAIFNNERKVFSEITTEADWKKLGVTVSEYKEPEKTLDELKSEKLAELTAITSKFTVNNCDEMHITSSLGYAINADKTAQDNIRGLIEAHGESDIIKYKIYDNSFKEVTIADLKIMLKECAKNGENLYTQKFLYQEKIKACKTIKELEKITFDFVMLDFSEVT